MQSFRRACAVGVVILSAAVLFPAAGRGDDEESEATRLFELRTYTAAEGKLDQLHARFRDHTNELFRKHGMTIIGFWTPTDSPRSQNTLVYILAYPDLDARKTSWKGFLADPEWQRAFRESREDGPLVEKVESVYLNPTDYSPLK